MNVCCRYPNWNFLEDLISRDSVMDIDSDSCSNGKLRKLKDMLKWNTSVRRFQFIHSKESTFLQLADVIMGAINYNLRINAGEIEGKVMAKRRIIDIIKSHKTDWLLTF